MKAFKNHTLAVSASSRRAGYFSRAVTHFIKFIELKSFFLAAASSNGRHVYHPVSELNKSAPGKEWSNKTENKWKIALNTDHHNELPFNSEDSGNERSPSASHCMHQPQTRRKQHLRYQGSLLGFYVNLATSASPLLTFRSTIWF